MLFPFLPFPPGLISPCRSALLHCRLPPPPLKDALRTHLFSSLPSSHTGTPQSDEMIRCFFTWMRNADGPHRHDSVYDFVESDIQALSHTFSRTFDFMVATSTWDSSTTASSPDLAYPVEVINPASVTRVEIAKCLTTCTCMFALWFPERLAGFEWETTRLRRSARRHASCE